jgi:hypothetical protein
MKEDTVLRQQLLQLLEAGNAHLTFEDAVADFPLEFINTPPPNVPYTPWHLIEHMRIAQWDILAFVCDPEHVSPAWPEGYWPAVDLQADEAVWEHTLDAFRSDLHAVEELVKDPNIDLMAEIPHAPGYTYLREVLLVADHNAYHVGEFAILREVMGTWPEGRTS